MVGEPQLVSGVRELQITVGGSDCLKINEGVRPQLEDAVQANVAAARARSAGMSGMMALATKQLSHLATNGMRGNHSQLAGQRLQQGRDSCQNFGRELEAG
ncbi:TPA: hypothetical protein UOA92_000145 [Stenotrophomonas maltophilia]|uniref:hypothetical protein n=1 Tax=Stenotrophomonas maltophilia TaxID=40324 RepID=UPI0024026D3C|nr:hypothetical protein [Stenotrophomonas maltophilia]HEL5052393.1 hypothetical protein [Stenotrophomonas maltophilia]